MKCIVYNFWKNNYLRKQNTALGYVNLTRINRENPGWASEKNVKYEVKGIFNHY